MIKYVNLHAHSGYSIYDGYGSPERHLDCAYENGLSAHAFTEHGNMNSFSNHFLHCKKMNSEGKNMKPLYGVEAYYIPSVSEWEVEYRKVKEEKAKLKKKSKEDLIDDDSRRLTKDKIKNNPKLRTRHLVLLAKNKIGLKNIFKMVSESHKGQNFFRKPRIDKELLTKHKEGIIALSACLGGVLSSEVYVYQDDLEKAYQTMLTTAFEFKQILGNDFYIELQWNHIPEQHIANTINIEIANKLGLKLVSTADCHYPSPKDFKYRFVYNKLGWLGKANFNDIVIPETPEEIGYEIYPKNGAQMYQEYIKTSHKLGFEYDDDIILESITRTHDIAFNIIEEIEFSTEPRMPSFLLGGKNPDIQLRQMCEKALVKKFGFNQEYRDQMKHELDVITSRGFSAYFLTTKRYIDEAKKLMLVGPARGSAGGSLVSYLLGITQIDPIKHGLQFSRFLTKDSKGYPDIDTDFADNMLLGDHLVKIWGEENVTFITNYSRLKPKSVIKDVARMFDIPFAEVNKITKTMDAEAIPEAKQAHGITSGAYDPTYDEYVRFSKTLQSFLRKHPKVHEYAKNLVGEIRSLSRHAGGTIIVDDVDGEMPLIRSAALSKNVLSARKKMGLSNYILQTPWSEGLNVRHLEPLGFIKFDRLGLSTLSVIQRTIENILGTNDFKQVYKFYEENLNPDNLDLNDEKVYKYVFEDGRWPGIFQFTESGAQDFCKNVCPRNIIDLSAITSIYRPGPLSAKSDVKFVEAKQRPDDVHYDHDIFKNVLEETYGLLVFQEQISSLASSLSEEISLSKAQKLRKIITKKGTGDHVKEREWFVQKMVEGGVKKGISEQTVKDWIKKIEYFANYGFNKSHAVAYSIISFQCAYLFTYYPEEWLAAFLDFEPEKKKADAIMLVRSFGYKIRVADINISQGKWVFDSSTNSFVQPLVAVKGVGEKAIKEIFKTRPYSCIENLLYVPEARKVNKRVLKALYHAGILDNLQDERFKTDQEFFMFCIEDKPKTLKSFHKKIEDKKYYPAFNPLDRVSKRYEVTGIYPVMDIVGEELMSSLYKNNVYPISQLEEIKCDTYAYWGIILEVSYRKTKKGNKYAVLKTIDNTNKQTTIKAWSWKDDFEVLFHRPYLMNVTYQESWGISTRNFKKDFAPL